MKKALLISSILLASAGCAAENGELTEVRDEALASRDTMVDKVFVSTKTFAYTTYDRVEGPNGHSDWVERQVQVKVRLKFIPASDYGLDDGDTGLDYEVVAEKFVESTGERFYDDGYSFFVKKTATGHQFFNCSSTRRCWTESDISKMEVKQASGREVLRIENHFDALIDTENTEIEFVRVAK